MSRWQSFDLVFRMSAQHSKSISKGFANKLCIALFAKKSRKYPSNSFANKVCNLVNFANRGWGFAYMQTFPPLCIYNFGISRRTPSPSTPRDFSTPVRPPCRARPPYLDVICAVPVSSRRRTELAAARPGDSRASTNNDVRCHVWTTYAATARERRWTFPRRRTEPNWRERRRRRTTNAAWVGRRLARRPRLGDDLAWAATDTHDVRQNGAKRKNTRTRSVKKKIRRWGPHFRFANSKCKVPWSWTIFRLCKWVWDFANNTKCKIHLQSPLEMLLGLVWFAKTLVFWHCRTFVFIWQILSILK